MVVRLGFEPRLKESKSRVLPLHYRTIKLLYVIFIFFQLKKQKDLLSDLAPNLVPDLPLDLPLDLPVNFIN